MEFGLKADAIANIISRHVNLNFSLTDVKCQYDEL